MASFKFLLKAVLGISVTGFLIAGGVILFLDTETIIQQTRDDNTPLKNSYRYKLLKEQQTPPRMVQTFEAMSTSELNNVPFVNNFQSVVYQHIFTVNAKDFSFNNANISSSSNDDANVDWDCDMVVKNILIPQTYNKKNGAVCRLLLAPSDDKCDEFNKLMPFSLKNITRSSQLPQKLYVALTAFYNPYNFSIQSVTWKKNGKNVFSIDGNKLIKKQCTWWDSSFYAVKEYDFYLTQVKEKFDSTSNNKNLYSGRSKKFFCEVNGTVDKTCQLFKLPKKSEKVWKSDDLENMSLISSSDKVFEKNDLLIVKIKKEYKLNSRDVKKYQKDSLIDIKINNDKNVADMQLKVIDHMVDALPGDFKIKDYKKPQFFKRFLMSSDFSKKKFSNYTCEKYRAYESLIEQNKCKIYKFNSPINNLSTLDISSSPTEITTNNKPHNTKSLYIVEFDNYSWNFFNDKFVLKIDNEQQEFTDVIGIRGEFKDSENKNAIFIFNNSTKTKN